MIQCTKRTTENSQQRRGGFCPPGRMRSRSKSGSKVANDTMKTAAKIAR